ncbi:MAG: hypothetical protein WCF33_13695 [Pseudonocardiaceae bacterium]
MIITVSHPGTPPFAEPIAGTALLKGNGMPHLKQPVLGIVATILVMVISFGFISLFDWPTFRHCLSSCATA